MEGVYTVHPGYSVKTSSVCHPTLAELIQIATKDDKKCNISVYDAEADEYYPVEAIFRATDDNGTLDENHIILAIKYLNDPDE